MKTSGSYSFIVKRSLLPVRKIYQNNFILVILFVLLFTAGCKQEYKPPAIDQDLGLLVIDGFLNNSPDTTILRLTRTAKLQNGLSNTGELNATITINDANGNPLYFFQQLDDKGNYFLPGMNLGAGIKYSLAINTANGKLYQSDEIEPKATPPIDSVSWERNNNGLQVFVNTHDPARNTEYYRWEYTETWEYLSNFYSSLKYEDNTMLFRNFPADQVLQCWTTRQSTNLMLASSAKLSKDIIYRNPIQQISLNSIELNVLYSINVRQYALSKDAFDYLINLKKLTEQRGTIFDAQPTELPGNIHCVSDPSEAVIGYVMASTMQSQRIFIRNRDVMPWRFNYICDDHRVFSVDQDTLDFYFGTGYFYVPIEEVRIMGVLVGYDGGAAECVDCRRRGGTSIKPAFWP